MLMRCISDLEFDHLDDIRKNLQASQVEILEDVGLYMVAETVLNFEEEGRPDKWVENAESTKEQKSGDMILSESGLFKAGIMYWVEGDAVYIGPSGPASIYSRIHYFGGETGQGGKTVIPSRKYMVILDENRDYIHNAVRKGAGLNG